MPTIKPRLNVPQTRFLALPHKYALYVGGFGAGKTWAGISSTCQHLYEFPKVPAGYFGPNYRQIKDIYYPTVDEVAHDWGLRTTVRTGDREVDFYMGARYRGTVICRSVDNPAGIVGFKIGDAHVDEVDTLREDHAEAAWNKIIARMRVKREGLRNRVKVTTTPEGFRFAYARFVKMVADDPSLASLYGRVQASTYSNAKNLPDDYITSLRQSYPGPLIAAYLRGEFTNLTSGSVYHTFSRTLNHSNETVQPGEHLHVGMDFNVGKMAAIVHVLRDGLPHAVAEHLDVFDTPAMCRALLDAYPGHRIHVYPDASGKNTSTKNASESDIAILKKAGFRVWEPAETGANPAVKDRVNAVNAMLHNDSGERRYRVNTHTCPGYTEALEKQPYDKSGAPDKKSGFDHPNDAGGYFIVAKWPVKRRYVVPGTRKYLDEQSSAAIAAAAPVKEPGPPAGAPRQTWREAARAAAG